MSTSSEIMNSHFNLEFDVSTQCFWVQDVLGHKLTFSSPLSPQQALADRVCPIWEHTKNHPAAMALLQESLNNGSISVVFKAQEDLRGAAHWHNSKRVLGLLVTLTDPHALLDYFIFELNNSVNKKFCEGGDIMIFNDTKDAEEYAFQLETAEYETNESTAQIIIEGLNKYNWPAPIGNNKHRLHCNLEEYLLDVRCQRRSHSGISHFDGYQLDYCRTKIIILDVIIEQCSSVMVEAEQTMLDLNAYKDIAKNDHIQRFKTKYEGSNAKVIAAKKEKMELISQKEAIENDAKNWKERQGSEDKLLAEIHKNIEQYNLEINKQRAYLDKIRALPQYAHNLLLQTAVSDVYSGHLKIISFDLYINSSFNARDEEQFRLLQNVKQQNKKLVEVLHTIDMENSRPLTFMKTRESAINQQKWAPEDKGGNDWLNYKRCGYGFGGPGIVDTP